MKHFKYLIILTAIFVAFSDAIAEVSSTSPQLSDKEIVKRLNFIEDRFNQGKFHAQAWQYGWLSAFSASVAGRSYIVATDDGAKQFDAGVGIFTSTSGLLSVLLKPLPASYAVSRLQDMPESTPEQRQSKLAYAEQLLKSSAMEVKRRRGWKIQGVFLIEQLLAGLAIGIVDDRLRDGLKVAALGMLASEIFTFTLPTQSLTDWHNYQAGSFGSKPNQQSFYLLPKLNGMQLVYQF